MTVSAKCYYALRAVYALAEYQGTTPLKANEIAERSTFQSSSWRQFSAS